MGKSHLHDIISACPLWQHVAQKATPPDLPNSLLKTPFKVQELYMLGNQCSREGMLQELHQKTTTWFSNVSAEHWKEIAYI